MTASFFYEARFGPIKVIYFPKVPVSNQESKLDGFEVNPV
jgi:hypothetical protein